MSFAGPNLSREPFANVRPLWRAAATLWVAAALLVAWNVAAYLRSGTGAVERAAELERLRRTTAESRARIQTLESDLQRADLARANARTEYLNQRIGERAFSWNLLLDRLAETMPRGVRVVRLSPEPFKDDRRRGEVEPAPRVERRVALEIAGEAEDDEALLEFVDRLFSHAAFDRPSLARETRTKAGTLNFTISAAYRPAAEVAPEPPAAAVAGGAAAAGPRAPAPNGLESAAARSAAAAASGAGRAPEASTAAAAAAGRAARVAAVDAPAAPRTGPPPATAEGGAAARSRPAGAASGPAAPPAAGGAPRESIFGGPAAARPYASPGGVR